MEIFDSHLVTHNLSTILGDVAQLGERGVRNAEARSSILLISTKRSENIERPFEFLGSILERP